MSPDGAGDELTSLLVAMDARPQLPSTSELATDTGSSCTFVGKHMAGSGAAFPTKLAESAPLRHKAHRPHDSSSGDSSSSDSSSNSGGESSSGSGTDGEDSGLWITPHDPNRPKRPQTSYFMFLAAERKRTNGGAMTSTQALSAAWKAMTAEEKSPYEKLAANDAQRYKQAIANYVAPAKIQLSANPTPEEERLYATDIARYRAKRERKRQRRRAIAQARREERERAREQQRMAKQAALQAEQLKQAQDVARLRERNLGSKDAGDGRVDVNGRAAQKADSKDDADAERSCDEGIAHAVEGRRLRARNGDAINVAVNPKPMRSRGSARKSKPRHGPGIVQKLKDVAGTVTVPITTSREPARAVVATCRDDDVDSTHSKHVSWRMTLDVWSALLCQDVTMAWCKLSNASAIVIFAACVAALMPVVSYVWSADEALVVDVRGDEVLIRYIAWDPSFDEWVPRSSSRLAERGTRLLAHMSAKDVLGTYPRIRYSSTLTVRKRRRLYLNRTTDDSRVCVCCDSCRSFRGCFSAACFHICVVAQQRTGLPVVTEEQAVAMEPGTLIWLKWNSPGAHSIISAPDDATAHGDSLLVIGGNSRSRRGRAQRMVVGYYPQTLVRRTG